MFADRLRQAREAAGLTGPALVNKAQAIDPDVKGLSPQRVSDWENGRRPVPSIDKLLVLAEALGVEHLWLAGHSEEGGPTTKQDAA